MSGSSFEEGELDERNDSIMEIPQSPKVVTEIDLTDSPHPRIMTKKIQAKKDKKKNDGECKKCLEREKEEEERKKDKQEEEEEEEDDPACPICLSPMRLKQGLSVTYCHHVFCTSCIKEWIRKDNVCPKCRLKYPAPEKIKF